MAYWKTTVLSGIWLLFPALGTAGPPDAALWRAQQMQAATKADRIMHQADRAHGLLAQYQLILNAAAQDHSPAFRVIFNQYVSWYQSFIGDYPDAAARYSIMQPLKKGDRPAPGANSGFKARSAVAAIARLARSRRAVFFNEAHNVALTRSVTVQMLRKLRDEGYDYFAVETLYQDDSDLQKRGYPTIKSGFYTREPIYAEMVRTALKLGFKVVAYEADEDATGDAREAQQARNIIRRVFHKSPDARLVVNAGYAHIKESGPYLGGKSMAEYFHRFTGIDPLTVEQTILIPHATPGLDHPDYTAVMRRLHPRNPIVFINAGGAPWAIRPGYDVSVFFPPVRMRNGRPTWLSLGGLRRPYPVDADICRQHVPCLVQARYVNEGPDAIPADRMLLSPARLSQQISHASGLDDQLSRSELYLRPGTYRLSAESDTGQIVARHRIAVPVADEANDRPAVTRPDSRRRSARPAPFTTVTSCPPEISFTSCQ